MGDYIVVIGGPAAAVDVNLFGHLQVEVAYRDNDFFERFGVPYGDCLVSVHNWMVGRCGARFARERHGLGYPSRVARFVGGHFGKSAHDFPWPLAVHGHRSALARGRYQQPVRNGADRTRFGTLGDVYTFVQVVGSNGDVGRTYPGVTVSVDCYFDALVIQFPYTYPRRARGKRIVGTGPYEYGIPIRHPYIGLAHLDACLRRYVGVHKFIRPIQNAGSEGKLGLDRHLNEQDFVHFRSYGDLHVVLYISTLARGFQVDGQAEFAGCRVAGFRQKVVDAFVGGNDEGERVAYLVLQVIRIRHDG